MKATIVVTTAHEVELAKECISALAKPANGNCEILVVSPDTELEEFCSSCNINYMSDPGKGKIAAMNLALDRIKEGIVIWTDGDCRPGEIQPLIDAFNDPKVGAAGGAVFAKEQRTTKWGFFNHFLTSAANDARARRAANGKFIELSGYLWAFRRELVLEIPYDVAEDSAIPLAIYKKGYRVAYVPAATVYVTGPSNFKDWFSQKKRSSKAHERLQQVKDVELMKTFKNEMKEGLKFMTQFKFTSFKERIWLFQLMAMRGWMWATIRFMPKYGDNWQRVDSTKH